VRNQVSFQDYLSIYSKIYRVCSSWRRLSNFIPLSDSVPEILDMASYLEGNLNSSHKITCSATGHPLPSHMSIELRKLESTVLKVKES